MVEEWKDIEGYEGLYQVSNMGFVRNRHGRLLTREVAQRGYLRVRLSKGAHQSNHKIHRLVAQAFIPNPNRLPQVNHKNEDKTDNRVVNLEWTDNKTNYILNTNKAHGKVGVIMIDNGKEVEFESLKQATTATRISRYSIVSVCKGIQKTAGGKQWRYKE